MFAIKSGANHFVCLHKLIYLSGQLVVLVADDTDVVVHGIDLNLEVGIVFEKSAVRVTGTF